jgi:nitrous oxidase accessory protein
MRKNIALLLVLVFLTASCLTVPSPVKAGSKTIVVPDDYPTISAAIGNATDGDTILVKKGTYEGPINQTLMINKTLSLIGEDANNTIINLHPLYTVKWILTQSFSGAADAITILANDVILSNFTIVPEPGGDISVSGERTQIFGNKIVGTNYQTSLHVKSSFVVIAGNTVSSIILENAHSNIISNNTCGYLQLGYANQTSTNNVVSGNTFGGGPTYFRGILIVASSNNVFYNNYIANYRGWVGVTDGYGVVLRSYNGVVAENNTFYHNSFINNNKNVVIESSSARNFWDDGKEGNYWEDYNGTDANRDGIGDVSYVIDGDNIDNYPLMFPFDIENDTVVLPPPEPFPTILVAAAAMIVAVVIVGVLVYFRKRNH